MFSEIHIPDDIYITNWPVLKFEIKINLRSYFAYLKC